MTSPSMVHRSGDTLVVRSVVSGNQLFTSDNEPETDTEDIDYCDEYFDPDDNKNLPECKIRRNYSCVTCHFFTQNPRHYLYHLRDVHKEKVKIYECSNCLYASKHFQKLLRHVKMVHAATDAAEIVETQHRQKVRRKRKRPAADVEPDEDDEEPPPPAAAMSGALQQEQDNNEDSIGINGDADDCNKSASDLKCSLCPFTTKHQGQLTRHEKQEHIKTKFFRCSKCSYVTHIKARFTKHVKYHSMPMIKCDLCDFRTPYKWNLDRHYKNHNGHGAFRCSACNFTADIKQSLTVHEMNHHVPPVGQAAGLGVGRRRNKVGASDTTAAEEAAAAAANTISGDTLTTLPSGLTISGQTRDFSHQNADDGNAPRKNPKIKISLKKSKTQTQEQNERHNFDTDFINPDDIIHHSNGNIYIKNKCKLCNFKSAWTGEMAKHERKVHNIVRDADGTGTVVKKTPRPIPNLIPIQPAAQSQQLSANSLLKIPIINNQTSVPFGGHIIPRMDEYNPPEPENIISQKDLNDMCAKSGNSALKDFASLLGEDVMFGNEKPTSNSVLPAEIPQSISISSETNSTFKKKNASFFDKLKEKLMTGENCNLTCKWCGHESKCLSESAGHQKTCGKQEARTSTPTPGIQNVTSSTRCQHCRQRCKSSIDLHNHLQVCNKLAPYSSRFAYDHKPDITIKLEDVAIQEDSLERHPMENVVFVWNNISPQPPEELDRADELSMDLSIRVRTPESEASLMECETMAGSSASTPVKMPTHGTDIDQITDGRRVFKCPHCSFWATTASRFHVHIVGHLNKKPFECSLCAYRSNWRWDITKHIRLKSVRDPEHEKARVLMTDETGRRNYSKYNKYLTQLRSNDSSSQDSNSAARKAKSEQVSLELPKLTRAPNNNDFQMAVHANGNNPLRPPPPLKAANEVYFQSYPNSQNKRRPSSDSKKTLFKCKKCNFRDASRENILSHVKGHYRQDNNNISMNNNIGNMNMNMNMNANINMNMNMNANMNMNMNNVPGNAESDEASVSRGQAPFRCGHCHQVSNWKHVIQRHCRLKHSGDVRVVIGGKNGVTEKIEVDDQTDEPDHMDVIQSGVFKCKNCPYSVDSQDEFDAHLEMHMPKNDSTMKCYFCPYYVAQKYQLFDHLRLHGVMNPEDYVNRAMQGRELASPNNVEGQTFKRYKCVCCPYVSNSKSQFLYHKQFHRHRGGPFKCEFCSYNVTRRHLLHQHLKVHGVNLPTQKTLFKMEQEQEQDVDMDVNTNAEEYYGLDEIEEEIIPSSSEQQQMEDQQILFDVPLVWVSKDGKFSKMFKCRFCPHVNMRKVNIQEHEKMHSLRERNPNSPRQNDEHHCTECSYVCNNAGVLSSHLKVHQMVHGQIHCLVDTNKTDEEQINELTRLLSGAQKSESSDEKECFSSDDQEFRNYDYDYEQVGDRMLYFCDQCPARFLHEKELLVHRQFHGIRLFYRCDYCSYTARQRPHLLSHEKVHTEDYQDKTKYYLNEYPVCPNTPQPKTVVIFDSPSENKAPIWVVISNTSSQVDLNDNNNDDLKEFSPAAATTVVNRQSNKAFGCRKCPARFFKSDALKYHMTLHGCSNPYRCKYCDYAARTSSNLQKHHRVHEETEVFKPTAYRQVPSTSVPISGTDLFEQRNEAQRLSNEQRDDQNNPTMNKQMHIDPQFGTLVNGNPKFVYPTYLRNGRMKEKRYKCHKCPSAFEKREQYKVHLSLHGSNQKYNCENCDYSVKYYANYVQHIRKHELNTNGNEEEETTEPLNKLAIKSLKQQRAGPLKLSIADQQTLMIMQKRRASSSGASSSKESSGEDVREREREREKERKLFWCTYCPYTSGRRDALDNHLNRHICVSGSRNNYTCEHCDYSAPQSHFLRDHVKLHFMPPKNQQPEGYLVSSEMELTSINHNTNNDNDNNINSNNDEEEESVIFKDNGDNSFTPLVVELDETTNTNTNINTNNNNKNIYVNPQNGEFTDDAATVSVTVTDTKEPKKSL